MRSTLACLALACSLSPAFAQDDPAPEPTPAGDEEDGEGEEAKRRAEEERQRQEEERKARQAKHDQLREAAEDVLHAKNVEVDEQGRLVLHYDFGEAEAWEDWQLRGFERTHRDNPRRLAVNSSAQGLALHCLELVGDFEIEFQVRVIRTSTETELVFGVGKAGARWGTQLVKRGSRGFRPISRRSQVDQTPFAGGREVKVRFVREGGNFSVAIGEGPEQVTTKLSKEAEGKLLLYASDIALALQHVRIRALVDSDQINRLGFE